MEAPPPGGESPSGAPHGASSSTSGSSSKPRGCLGVLYFSSGRNDALKPPVSARSGVRAGRAADTASPPPHSSPLSPQSTHPPTHPPTPLQLCAGLGKKLAEGGGPAELPADSVPGGDFK